MPITGYWVVINIRKQSIAQTKELIIEQSRFPYITFSFVLNVKLFHFQSFQSSLFCITGMTQYKGYSSIPLLNNHKTIKLKQIRVTNQTRQLKRKH